MELIIENRKGRRFIVLFDECDLEIVKSHKWHISNQKKPYPRTTMNINGIKMNICLHDFIMGTEYERGFLVEVDHKNRNPLDNRRNNLRIATQSQNSKNRTPFGKSKFLGVCKSTGRNKWQATIKINGKYKMIGRFDSEVEAAIAYDNMAKQWHGEFANLNFPPLYIDETKNDNGVIYSKDIKVKSNYLGVTKKTAKQTVKSSGKERQYTYWFANICIDGKIIKFGSFKTEREAAIIYDVEVKKRFGDNAILNFKE